MPPSVSVSSALVYPRVCGGTAIGVSISFCDVGLSPRVRGHHLHIRPRRPLVRSIPACAGAPLWSHVERNQAGVYPRVCGGTIFASQSARFSNGLSPRVRGHPVRPARGRLLLRSIPACAGAPTGPHPECHPEPVYPRVCGGTPLTVTPSVAASGLSPRVRGHLERPHVEHVAVGSIPACAGAPAVHTF